MGPVSSDAGLGAAYFSELAARACSTDPNLPILLKDDGQTELDLDTRLAFGSPAPSNFIHAVATLRGDNDE